MKYFLPKVISSIEEVYFLELKSSCMARIDTGAYYNVIHCNKINLVSDNLVFQPLGDGKYFSSKKWKKVKIVSSNGLSEYRYIISLETSIGKNSSVSITCLTNRKNMKYPVLIGRKFLAKHNLLVHSM